MEQYLSALRTVLEDGSRRPNRTGVDTISLFGQHLTFDLRNGFPAVTTKRLAFRQIVGELIGFIRGYSNAKDFRELDCTVWDANANAPYWKLSKHCEGDGDLGRIYGVQWRRWKTENPVLEAPVCVVQKNAIELTDLPTITAPGDIVELPYPLEMFPIKEYKTVDQLADVIERIKLDPYDRRLIVSAWNPGELDQMALPPCHVMFQFYVTPWNEKERERYAIENDWAGPWAEVPKGYLDLSMYQRSADMFLGVPFNIASYALLLSMVAHVTGYKPRYFHHFIGDVHIYENHIEQVQVQLSREPLPLPKLGLSPGIQNIDEFQPGDVVLLNYHHHPALKGEMAV